MNIIISKILGDTFPNIGEKLAPKQCNIAFNDNLVKLLRIFRKVSEKQAIRNLKNQKDV